MDAGLRDLQEDLQQSFRPAKRAKPTPTAAEPGRATQQGLGIASNFPPAGGSSRQPDCRAAARGLGQQQQQQQQQHHHHQHHHQHQPAADEDEWLNEVDDDSLSDVMVAFQALKADYRAAAAREPDAAPLPHLALKTQLYHLLSHGDRTALDRELDRLRRAGRVRGFKLAIGADEHAYLLTTDYEEALRSAAASRAAGGSQPPTPSTAGAAAQPRPPAEPSAGSPARADVAQAAELFIEHVLPHCSEISVSRQHLLALLAAGLSQQQQALPGPVAAAAGTSNGRNGQQPTAAVLDKLLTALMSLGAISRHPHDDGVLLFAVPGGGPVIKAVAAGRAELIGLLSRRKYNEMPEKQLLAKIKLRSSRLGVLFHLRDLVGAGTAALLPTGMGNMVKLLQPPAQPSRNF